MKTKSLEEVKVERNKLQDEIKIHFKIQTTLIVIVSILAIIVCFKAMSLAIDYEALNKEKKALEEYIEIENVRNGGNV